MSYTLRTRVYVAGPISQGDPVENCQRAIDTGFVLMDHGYAPYVPHYSYFVDIASTHGHGRYKQWISLDLSWIATCHALLRLSGPSKGADREVAWAKEIGIPVYYDLQHLLETLPQSQWLEPTITMTDGRNLKLSEVADAYHTIQRRVEALEKALSDLLATAGTTGEAAYKAVKQEEIALCGGGGESMEESKLL